MNKTAIKNFAIQARNKLIADVCYRAGLVGITEKGIQAALPQSDSTTEFYDIGIATPYAISGQAAIRQRRNLAEAIQRRAADSDYPTAYRCIMEEVAYTWFNRLIAVRFMEVNDYLPGRVRVLSSESGKIEPDLVTNPFDAELSFTAEEEQAVLRLKQDNKLDELFRLLFIKQCNALAAVLPALFEQRSDYTELLLNLSVVDQEGVVWHLTHDIPEDDFNVEKGGQVEIIGWLYQYYNTEPKAQVFARPSGQKIKKEDIPAATQLFTPDWIVRYMVENSLGRLWLEGHPDGELRDQWKYYLDEAEQEPDVAAQLEELRAERRTLNPEDIHVIDPCMGSGHILVYAFDVLMQIYEKAGWERREAAQSIIVNNLYGLDIDKRAWQMAYFAVMMKARQYDRRFFTRGIQPKVYYPGGDKELEEFGSLVLMEKWDKPENDQISLQDTADHYRRLLAGKYDVVVTNPPYMATSNLISAIADPIKNQFPDEKADLFACFIECCKWMTKNHGYQAMITQHAWMFLSSYEKTRAKIRLIDTVNLLHLGPRAFEEIGGEVVQTSSFVFRKIRIAGYKGTYCRLIEPNTQQGKEDMFLTGENRYTARQDNFSKIPGSPVAYWVSDVFLQHFSKPSFLSEFDFKRGIATGNNSLFLRFWFEISIDKFLVFNKFSAKWFPYNKGGEFRKWYGNREYVVNWLNEGKAIREYTNNGKLASRPQNIDCNFKPNISYSSLTSSSLSFREYVGFINDQAGNYFIPKHGYNRYIAMALLNSRVAQYCISLKNDTLNTTAEDFKGIPLEDFPHVDFILQIVHENIEFCMQDWDSFETSWDFTRHPLVRGAATVAEAFAAWESECNGRFTQLKSNEEELNRIFIDIYGLQDELTPEVEDKDVTVRRADLGRDIRSLLSYAVGCMFGRYSLDVPGLAYAGGDFGSVYRKDRLVDEKGNPITFGGISISGSKDYTYISHDGTWIEATFPVNGDNIIPLTDEAYLEDDIVSRLCQWLRVVYGENTLEENLDFIAKALGNKGSTSREVIRNYFLKDFFTDHCKIYQKRPIYWLFDSGKQNGFKALVYLHRYTPDTIGKLRVDYLHRLQRVYASEIERMQDMIDNSQNPREVTTSTKRKEKLQKQLKECREYDEKIAHLALARIELDLDDGVKVNYEKVQTAADGRKYPVLGKI